MSASLPHSRIDDLNRDLQDPAKFKSFVADPAAFSKAYNLDIDPELSKLLAARLHGTNTLDEAKVPPAPASTHAFVVGVGGGAVATGPAVAVGVGPV